MEKRVNPLEKYLFEKKISILAFAKKADIPPSSLYNLWKGTKPGKLLVYKICKFADGLTMQDFGYE